MERVSTGLFLLRLGDPLGARFLEAADLLWSISPPKRESNDHRSLAPRTVSLPPRSTRSGATGSKPAASAKGSVSSVS